jgi:hypothetical protein
MMKSKELPWLVLLSSWTLLLHSHNSFILDKQASDLFVDSTFGTSNGQVHEMWECDLRDQADAWSLYPSMNVCHISPL